MSRAIRRDHIIGFADGWHDLDHHQNTIVPILVNRTFFAFHNFNIVFIEVLGHCPGQCQAAECEQEKIAEGPLEVYVMEADGSNVSRLTHSETFAIHPDW